MLIPLLAGEAAITIGGEWIGDPALDAVDGMGASVGCDLDAAGLGIVMVSAEDPFEVELDAAPGRW